MANSGRSVEKKKNNKIIKDLSEMKYVVKEGLVLRGGRVVQSCGGGRRWRGVPDKRRALHEAARALRERAERSHRRARAAGRRTATTDTPTTATLRLLA